MERQKSFGKFAGRIRLLLNHPWIQLQTMSGKVTLLTTVGCALLGFFIVIGFFWNTNTPKVSADSVTTSVTVLNTPPNWTIQALESTPSATTTPTNAGSTITWIATATDSSADNYWLIICKTNASPTANAGAAPTCGGGVANQWAASVSTVSGQVASAATTTKETFPFNNEKNDWFAWICDGNSSLPLCNAAYSIGTGGTDGSPFVINHPPAFTAIVNTSPQIPGATITWTATGADTDMIRGGDSIKLYVCKTAVFSAGVCSGGYWASSTIASTSAVATYSIPVPTQDTSYPSYAYVTDNYGLVATSTNQAAPTPYSVSNVPPVVSASSITVVNYTGSGNLALLTPNGKTDSYKVTFQASDNNSCQNASSGNEINAATASINVFRSGIGSSSCKGAGWNSNNCYPSNSGYTNFSCTQDGSSCTGPGDSDATFTCTFSLWYNADPTDGSSQYVGQKWSATVQVADDNLASSTYAEATVGSTTMTSFLAFAVTETAVAFGALQPGQQSDPSATTTQLKALGNVGVDESLYGDTMCTNWTGFDKCDNTGFDNTRDIAIANQKVATSSVLYSSSFAYALSGSTTPVSVALHVQKTTSTSSPQSKLTYWAIKIPASITVAGNYAGQDVITAVTSPSANW